MEETNVVLSTRENMKILIEEIEALSKELILQSLNSTKLSKQPNENNEILLELTKILVKKQTNLNNYLKIANEQNELYKKINKLKSALVESDSDIKNLLLYLKEAEQVLSSAVYQSRLKLNMIKKAKPIPSELIIRYAHQISSDFGVCCPENWTPDNPKRPYPTDADMRRGWLGKINMMNEHNAVIENDPMQLQKSLIRSNSKMIDPIVPQEFGFDKDKIASNTEYMSDLSSESSSESDNI